ncbi:MAG: hypothetical protein P8J89_00890 [Phycisphaerales bacterium]|nr:hypothetical protein [Phycisphaerales bacterium]
MSRCSMSGFLLLATCLLLPSCISSVPGYEGPRIQVIVENDTATIIANHRSSGWVLDVDRTQVENNTAKVWVTASTSGKGSSSTQKIFLDGDRFDNKSFACCQVFSKVTRSGTAHRDEYVPAGLACD